MNRLSFAVLMSVFLWLTGLSGCGSKNDGPERYDVSGSINYQGAPLESGRITFVPDAEKGNEGPVGYAMIKGGKYDTGASGGKGTVAGAIQILITGYDFTATGSNEIRPPLFEDYQATAEIDPEQSATTLDFDVPATAASKK